MPLHNNMRQIKFRAFDIAKKEWLLGYELPNLGGFSLFGETVMMGEWGALIETYIFERGGRKQEDLVVMQFTGLYDKNNKEIYEGDIVKSKMGNREIIGVMHFDEDRATYGISHVIDTNKVVPDHIVLHSPPEIIGNIHERPDLINT